MSNSINLKEFIERISYNKSQTYTKEEVLQELAKIQLLSIVDTLPTENIPSNKIFLVLNNEEIEGNKYDLFVYVNNKWEQIDSLEFNIEDYPTKNELDYELSLKADINHGHDNVTTSSDGFMSKEDKSKLNGIENQATRNLPSDDNPLMDGTASSGTGKDYSRKDHVHPTDTSRASSTHVHGNISNDGKIGSTANKPLITTTSGSVTTGNFETSTNNIKMDGTVNVGSSNNFARSDHVHPTDTSRASTDTATSSKNGLMSKEDKSKLDGVEDEANNYTHPSYTAKTNGLYKVTVDNTGHISGTNTVSGSDLPSHNHDTGDMKDTSAYGNIGSSANATQKTINNNINTKLGQKANSSDVYTKSQTMTSTEIGQAIADGVSNVEIFEVVTTLPTSNIKGNKFYLVPNGENIEGNVYDVNIYVNNKWETIDKLEFDISNYPTTTQVNSLLEGKVDKTDSRLTDSRTPKSHTHGNITNTGAIGSTSGKIVTTGTNGVLTTSDTITKSQISDFPSTMTPSSHTHGAVQNNGTLNSDTTSTNKVVVTDSSNNIKTISKLPLDKVTHQDISGKASSTHTHGSIANNGTLNSDTTTVGKVVVTDGSNNIKTISKLPSANVTHQDISGKAPNNHKSTATTYGVGDASNYGHVKVDSSMNASSTNPVQNKVVKDYIDEQVGDIVSGDVDLSDTHNHDDRYYTETEINKSMNIGYGTLGGTTSAYTVSITGVTLTHGTIIAIYNPIGNNSTNATLNVNSLGAKPIYYQAGAIPSGRFPNKSTGLFMYNTSIVSTGCWQMIYSFNSDTYNRLYQTTQVMPGENVSQYGLVWAKSDDKYYLIKSGTTYDIRHPILWASSALVSGTANVNLDQQYTSVNLQNTVSNKTVTAHRKVYVKGTLSNGQFTVHSDVFVSDDNLTDGFYYVPIGTSYSTYQIGFSSLDMTVYKYTTARGLIPVEHSLERYDGKFISGHASPTKPYLRLFNLKAKNSDSSSSHIIFEIIGNNNDRLYAKIRVDMRQNTSTSASTYSVTPLEVYGFNLDELYFGFRNAYPNTSLDIFRKVGAYTNFYIRYADDHTRDGTVTMYSPVVNSTESYTDLNEASTALYNASYTATSQGGTYGEVTNTIPYTNINANKFVKRGGTSSQFLKADGSVDSNTYLTTSNASSTYQPKGNYLTSHNPVDSALSSTSTNAVQNKVINTALGNKVDKVSGKGLSTNDFTATYKTALDNLNTTIANAVSNLEMIEVVTSLPTSNIKTNKLYLKANSVNGSENKYDFYVRVNNAWEKVDSLDFSISDYIKKDSNTNLLLSNGTTKAQSSFATSGHTHSYLPLSGGTLTGAVSSNSNITTTGHLTQSSDYNATSGATGNVPVATLLSTSDSITTYLPKIKSYIGAINFTASGDTSYTNVISARYRNGSGDGNVYGMYLKSKMQNANQNLIWNRQYGSSSNWQGERVILDSSNYSTYANKTTITNNLTTSTTGTALDASQGKWLKDNTVQTAGTGLTKSSNTLGITNGGVGTNQLADKSVTDAKLANYEYINGTQTASTSAWTGVTTKLTSTTIPTGTIIYYRLNQSSTSTNATLELKLSSDNTKTTGAKAVYLDDRRVTTHFRLGSIIPLRYDGTNWIVISPYTDNNTDTHNALEQGTRINVGEAVSANTIVGKVYGDSNGYYKKLVSGLQLDTSYPIFFMPTATTGATNGYSYPYHLKIGVNLQTTVSGVTITANKQVFVEGTALDKNKFTVSSKVFVSEGAFTTNNYYIPIGGSAGSTTAINFNSIDSRVFRATSATNLVPVDTVSYSQTTSSSSNTYEIGKITINGTSTTLYGKDTVYTAPSAYLTSSVKEASALGNLGTSANATQATVNSAINTKIGNLIDSTSTTKNGHTHGSIANNGTLDSDVTSANMNRLVVTDGSKNIKTAICTYTNGKLNFGSG